MELSLNQALSLLRTKAGVASRSQIFLVCGFQPLHLATFLKAHFAVRFPEQAADVLEGLYGDLEGNLALAARSHATAAAVVIEWSDLDSRLSLRSSGGWGPSAEQDILSVCRDRWARIAANIEDLAAKMPVALAPPTLPVTLFGHTSGWQTSAAEAELVTQSARFVGDASRLANVGILHSARLDALSPAPSRRDANLELAAGFPYTVGHASALGRQLIELLYPRSPMKGLITDLDDTLWSGIVGEVGPSAVSWNLSEHSQVHGLYQQELRHLSEIGVLLAIASKNEPAVVEEALRREDLYIRGDAFFPVRASWAPKSEAVRDILQTWNIGPESVVFVDDSPMEIGEVQAAFPSLTCLQFPRRNAAQALQLFEQLRDLFGKPAVQAEDALRQSSIRANAMLREAAAESTNRDFIRGLEGKLTFDSRKDGNNKRLLELINKTNQFNLNGVRITEGEWLRELQNDSMFAVGVSYEDKFGPLGVIAVMAGRQKADLVEVTSWVLSCRAFSRKIEHQMLDYLFRRRGAKTVRVSFQPTERNVPFQRFLRSMGLDCERLSSIDLTEGQLHPQEDLPHQVSVR